MAFIRQDSVGIIKAEAARTNVPNIGIGRVARMAAVQVVAVERVIFLVEPFGAGVRWFFELVEHVAVVIFIFAAIAVAIALEDFREVIRGDDAQEVSRCVVVAVARAVGDPRKIDANMDARIS